MNPFRNTRTPAKGRIALEQILEDYLHHMDYYHGIQPERIAVTPKQYAEIQKRRTSINRSVLLFWRDMALSGITFYPHDDTVIHETLPKTVT